MVSESGKLITTSAYILYHFPRDLPPKTPSILTALRTSFFDGIKNYPKSSFFLGAVVLLNLLRSSKTTPAQLAPPINQIIHQEVASSYSFFSVVGSFLGLVVSLLAIRSLHGTPSRNQKTPESSSISVREELVSLAKRADVAAAQAKVATKDDPQNTKAHHAVALAANLSAFTRLKSEEMSTKLSDAREMAKEAEKIASNLQT